MCAGVKKNKKQTKKHLLLIYRPIHIFLSFQPTSAFLSFQPTSTFLSFQPIYTFLSFQPLLPFLPTYIYFPFLPTLPRSIWPAIYPTFATVICLALSTTSPTSGFLELFANLKNKQRIYMRTIKEFVEQTAANVALRLGNNTVIIKYA
jgi:hypothetical protein